MHLDHVVLWVSDPERSLAFYVDVLGLSPVRAEEFERGEVSFPSARVNPSTILDLMDRRSLPSVQRFTGSGPSAGGAPLNHVCLSMSAEEHAALMTRLADRGIPVRTTGEGAFGARGRALRAAYLTDPDGNVLEVRQYPPAPGRP